MLNPQGLLTRMNEFFGGYRAESLKDELFEIFTAPSFFPELQTRRACFLFGGRGTGKTTILRALSYEGQHALGKQRSSTAVLPFVGLYHRIDLNHTAAFQGPELTSLEWNRYFGHYINIELCDALLRYALWYEETFAKTIELGADEIDDVAISLHLSEGRSLKELHRNLRRARTVLEAGINNVANPAHRPPLSSQGAPVKLLIEALKNTDALNGRDVFFLIDEYESLLVSQQRCFNTLIKYSGELFSFKIGVKELGLKTKNTLSESEPLSSPADYSRIDIADELKELFPDFARNVVAERFRKVFEPDGIQIGPATYFPGISEEDEAKALGASDRATAGAKRLVEENASADILEWYSKRPVYDQAFLGFLADSDRVPMADAVVKAISDDAWYDQKRNNYGYAFLFTLKRKKSGIRKYYAGWDTLCALAGANIRYLLHLVDESVSQAADDVRDLAQPIPPEIQTRAAQVVGRRILTDLEGDSREGARLTRLILGLGRLFQVMAANPEGHTPEVNEFFIRSDGMGDSDQGQLQELLNVAVMHLALLRLSGTKATSAEGTKDWDYTPHPIFAPFFDFSHRRKRKMGIDGSDLLVMATRPGDAIARILAEQRRSPNDLDIPDQMQLFEASFAKTAQ